MWTSLPSSLLELELSVFIHDYDDGADLLSNPAFIDSLKYLPLGILSFKLNSPHYNYTKLYLDSKGRFCFPKSVLDLVKTHPRLACIKLGDNELDLSRIDCNSPRQDDYRTTQRQLRELPPKQTGVRKTAKKTTSTTPYDVSGSNCY
jgi:hypothetical protein